MALASTSHETVDPHKKVIVITGVSQGLGRALALEFANDGHIIAGCSRNSNKLDALREELIKVSSCNHLLFNIDVKSDGCIKEMAHSIMEIIGAPDIIVNNAAVYHGNLKIWEVPEEEFDYVIDVNIKGTANVLRHFIPLMIPKNKGVIVNISSTYGRTGAAMASAYSASKWGIEGLTKSVAKEVGDNGMTIVALDPGIINTDMLAFRFGDLASQYQSPKQWASKAASLILNLTSVDNGASLMVHDPGILPS